MHKVSEMVFLKFFLILIFILCLLAVNMVNGMSVNGLGEVSMDTTQTIINGNMMANSLIALGMYLLFFKT